MEKIDFATATSIISIIIAILSLIIGVFYRGSDMFNSKSKKYHEALEVLYLKLLDIYTSDIKEKEVRITEFLESLYASGLNTSMILEEHLTFMQLKEASSSKIHFSKIESNFDSMAIRIEYLYWKHYEIKHYTAIQSDGWMDELTKKILVAISRMLSTVRTLISYLFWSILLLFITIIISYIFHIIGKKVEVMELALAITSGLSLLWVLSGLLFVWFETLINKSLKKLMQVSGDTFIMHQVKFHENQRKKL